MVHNLEIVEGRASMFYAKDSGVPWHGLGTAVPTAVTSKEAIQLAGLDWDVELRKVRLVDGIGIPQYRAITRTTDNKVFGMPTPDYKPIQNRDAFTFLDSLVQDKVLVYDTAGAINEGKTVWMLARMDEDFRIQDDVYGKFLLATTSHDALHSLMFWTTAVRVVCENTLMMATGAASIARVQHSGDIAAKMDKARQLMAISTGQQRRMEEWLRKLTEVEVEEAGMIKVRETLFGGLDEATPTQRKNAIDSFTEIYRAEAERCGETAYALAQTVTGYADHKVRVTAKSNRLASALVGRTAQVKQAGLTAVAELAGVKI